MRQTYEQWRTEEAHEEEARREQAAIKLTKEEYLAIRNAEQSPLYGLENVVGLRAPIGLGWTYSTERNGKVYRFSRAVPLGVRMDGRPVATELVPIVDDTPYPEAHGCPRVSDNESMLSAIEWVDRWNSRPPSRQKSWFERLF